MSELTLASFAQSTAINKQDALKFINNDFSYISKKTKAYLCGFDLIEEVNQKGEVVSQKLNKSQYGRSHKEKFFPQLEGLLYLLENTKNTLTKFVLFEYYYNPLLEKHDKSFFSDWGAILIENPNLLDFKTISEWFVVVLEDRMTLGAAHDKKIKVDLSYYKSQFYFSDTSYLNEIKNKYPEMAFIRNREKLVGFTQLEDNKYAVLINPTLDTEREVIYYNKKEFEDLMEAVMKKVY